MTAQIASSHILMIDTDVIIDYLRGQVDAVSFIEALVNPICISIITVAELYSGVREGEERKALDSFISVFELVPVPADVAVKGGLYRRDYRKSHNVGLADAIIAASAEAKAATLITLNDKHFPMLSVHVPYTKS